MSYTIEWTVYQTRALARPFFSSSMSSLYHYAEIPMEKEKSAGGLSTVVLTFNVASTG